jgi:hypothetical protein
VTGYNRTYGDPYLHSHATTHCEQNGLSNLLGDDLHTPHVVAYWAHWLWLVSC